MLFVMDILPLTRWKLPHNRRNRRKSSIEFMKSVKSYCKVYLGKHRAASIEPCETPRWIARDEDEDRLLLIISKKCYLLDRELLQQSIGRPLISYF